MTNGQAIRTGGSTTVDLQAGAISLVPIYLESPITSNPLNLILVNPAPGALVQIILFNQSGVIVPFLISSQDSLGKNIPVIMSNLGQIVFFSKGPINVPGGTVYSVVGGLVIPDNILFFALR